MKIYYSMDAAWERHEALRDPYGEKELKPMVFYAETEEIRADYENNPDTDWWLVDEFDTIEDAENDFYREEALELAEMSHP